jgi:hypothetical protein
MIEFSLCLVCRCQSAYARCEICLDGLCEDCYNSIRSDIRENAEENRLECEFCTYEINKMCKNCEIQYVQYLPGSEVSQLCECDLRCQCWNNAATFVKLQNEIPDFILKESYEKGYIEEVCQKCSPELVGTLRLL